MSKSSVVAWNDLKFIEFKAAYNAAVAARQDTFHYEEKTGFGMFARTVARHEFATSYAKHLIEYLDRQFAATPVQPKQPYNEGEEGQ